MSETEDEGALLPADFFPVGTKLSDPAGMAWPATLPVEIVLQTAPLADILGAYNISLEEWDELRFNPHFQKAVQDAKERAAEEGFSFRTKARMQAEAMLETSWALVHNVAVPPNVRADLIKFTARVAGYDVPKAVVGDGMPGFKIEINFGGNRAQPAVEVNGTNPLDALEAP